MEAAAVRLRFNGVVYVRHGDLVVERAFGTADADARVPITARTLFSVASASKMFTAVGIGRLADRGAVELDAPIGRYLDGLPPGISAITIAQLLNHTSGLGDYLDPRHRKMIESATTATALLPLALAMPPAFPPGSKRSYSNSGFVVLGAVIEKVAGLGYSEFIRREILDSVGMTQTRLDGSGAATPMTLMSPGGRLESPRPSPFAGQRASPAGGAISTSADISRFLTALQEGKLVSPATRDLLIAPRADPAGKPGTYGYGFTTRTSPHLRVGHGGGAPGINAEIALLPESGWQLIALSNNDPPAASRLLDTLESSVLAEDSAAACASPG
jgi:CubicO group peptidase (beta-lactamase class C family)